MAEPWLNYQSTSTDEKPWEKYKEKPKTETIHQTMGQRVPKIGMDFSSAGGPAPELAEGEKITPHGLVRPALEMGGFALGATTGPLGAGAGYAGGRQLANIYEAATGTNEEPLARNIPESLKKTGKEMAVDVPVGVGMEYLGRFGNKAMQAGYQKLGTWAEGIWRTSAIF